jgi:hypothetical protein
MSDQLLAQYWHRGGAQAFSLAANRCRHEIKVAEQSAQRLREARVSTEGPDAVVRVMESLAQWFDNLATAKPSDIKGE